MAQVTLSPHTQESYVTRDYPSVQELEVIAERAHSAQTLWAEVPLDDRIKIAEKFVVGGSARHADRSRPNLLFLAGGVPEAER